MKFWDKITGNDINVAFKHLEFRAMALPADYLETWEKIKEQVWQHSDFTGRNLMPVLENVIDLLEESAQEGLTVSEVLGEDVQGFCKDLLGEENANTFRDKWRRQLNRNVARRLAK